MKQLKYMILFLVIAGCQETDNRLTVKDFKPVGMEIMQVENQFYENIRDDWPVFSDKILDLNGKTVRITGYYHELGRSGDLIRLSKSEQNNRK